MSAPSTAWFCENGHLVMTTDEAEIFDDPEKCKECGTEKLGMVCYWGNPSYGKDNVPTKPIRHEKKRVKISPAYDAHGNPIEAFTDRVIPIYDVSKLVFPKKEG